MKQSITTAKPAFLTINKTPFKIIEEVTVEQEHILTERISKRVPV